MEVTAPPYTTEVGDPGRSRLSEGGRSSRRRLRDMPALCLPHSLPIKMERAQ